MGAPVRDDAIRTIWCVAPATVSNDRVIGNVWRDRQLVDRLEETIPFGMRFSVLAAASCLLSNACCGVEFCCPLGVASRVPAQSVTSIATLVMLKKAVLSFIV